MDRVKKGGISRFSQEENKMCACVCTNTRETNMLHLKELIYITVRAIESCLLITSWQVGNSGELGAAD